MAKKQRKKAKESNGIKIEREALQRALTIVKPGLAANELIEQTTSFAFSKGHVITYNDEISLRHPVDGLGIEGAIQSKELYALLSKIQKETLTAEVEGNAITIKAGRSKAGFVMDSEIKIPLGITDSIEKWNKIPDGFLEAVKQSALVASKDHGRPILMCVHVHKDGFIEGGDGFRISRTSFTKAFKFGTFLLPAESALQVVEVHPTHIALEEQWVHFKNDEGTIISARLLELDSYPNTDHILSVEVDTYIQLSKDLWGIMERAEPFYKRAIRSDEKLHMEIAGKKIKVKAETLTGSWFEESIPNTNEEELSFTISPYILKDILDAEVEIGITKKQLKVETDVWQYTCLIQ